jgi:Na+-driven multidrug efflux pump
LFSVAATLIARTAVGMAAYMAMTAAATRLGPLPTAAHQIAMQTFWFLSFFPEPLSMAAQSLLPRDAAAADDDAARPAAAAARARLLQAAGAGLGAALAGVVALVFARGAWVFTSDPAVAAAVAALAPLGALCMALCGPLVALDGIAIGSGDYAHLPPAIGAGLLGVLGVLGAGRARGAGLEGVWWALAAFYALRLMGHGAHFWRARRRSVFAGGGAGA